MLNKEKVEAEEEMIRSESLQLPEEERRIFHAQFNSKIKDPDTYATLAWSLPIGLHHFYLGQWGRSLLDITLFCLGVFSCFSEERALIGFGIFLILCICVAELYSLFRSQLIVQNHNNHIMRKILSNISHEKRSFR